MHSNRVEAVDDNIQLVTNFIQFTVLMLYEVLNARAAAGVVLVFQERPASAEPRGLKLLYSNLIF